MKRMMHPQHGYHHAADPHDEARMRAAGWVDDDQTTKAYPQPAEDVLADAGTESNEPDAPRQKRAYNRKPKD